MDPVLERGEQRHCRGVWMRGIKVEGIEGRGDDCRWKKPILGELKLNCNAAWRKDTKVGGVGWVL